MHHAHPPPPHPFECYIKGAFLSKVRLFMHQYIELCQTKSTKESEPPRGLGTRLILFMLYVSLVPRPLSEKSRRGLGTRLALCVLLAKTSSMHRGAGAGPAGTAAAVPMLEANL